MVDNWGGLVYIYIYTHARIYTYIQMHICMPIHIHVRKKMHTYIHTHICIYTHAYMCTYVCACIYIYVRDTSSPPLSQGHRPGLEAPGHVKSLRLTRKGDTSHLRYERE